MDWRRASSSLGLGVFPGADVQLLGEPFADRCTFGAAFGDVLVVELRELGPDCADAALSHTGRQSRAEDMT